MSKLKELMQLVTDLDAKLKSTYDIPEQVEILAQLLELGETEKVLDHLRSEIYFEVSLGLSDEYHEWDEALENIGYTLRHTNEDSLEELVEVRLDPITSLDNPREDPDTIVALIECLRNYRDECEELDQHHLKTVLSDEVDNLRTYQVQGGSDFSTLKKIGFSLLQSVGHFSLSYFAKVISYLDQLDLVEPLHIQELISNKCECEESFRKLLSVFFHTNSVTCLVALNVVADKQGFVYDGT